MKSTETFKSTILTYLDDRAATDTLFAAAYLKENKNIDDCITYILNAVQKSGCNGFADEEIFGMAVHYYDEDIIEIGKPINTRVVINRSIELSDDEVKEARQAAKNKIIAEEMARIQKKDKKPEQKQETASKSVTQGSLF